MSEQKLISPLLDGFIMGEPMSSHDGVRCCPAIRENSDDKYIVKIISVPASQKQLDALLLTGAFKDAAGATEYFKELTGEVVKEAKILQQLSKLEGFLSYEGWQVVPMENNDLGYEIYLVGSYKHSLEKYMRRNTMTHLGAVNLGLDLCAALSVCRRAGLMYVDLKPGNIFLAGEREYRIGDLGFTKLNSLKFTSLPSKYRSRFTPPELHNEMATLNPTVDVYAVGMILYMIYNDGLLPFAEHAPAGMLPAPVNADYEMAEIILKACHPNPRHRWQSPIEMGQAIAAYMQRNTVNDVPIVPPVVQPAPVAEVPVETEEEPDMELIDEAEPEQEESGFEPGEAIEELPLDNRDGEQDDAVDSIEIPEDFSVSTQTLDFLNALDEDETAPSTELGDDLSGVETSAEVQDILSQADDLIFFEPVAPASGEETAAVEASDDDEMDKFFSLHGITVPRSEDNFSGDDDDDDFVEPIRRPVSKKHGGSWIIALIVLFVLALAGGAGYYFYTDYYLLPIDNMEFVPFEDTITVSISTAVDESLLTVVCTDTYGNTTSAPVRNGKVVFTDLNSDTMYNISVEAEGFHKTSESHSGSCSTAKQTQIVDFTAKTGTEDGSVVLNFTVDGPETSDWIIEYSAAGEEPSTMTFTGHMVSISGLTLDQLYTFTLTPASTDKLWLVGDNMLEYTASRSVVAENLQIVSCVDGVLTAQWTVPGEAAVESWTVRCYSDGGYDETISVSDTTAQFTGINGEDSYTVEVTAAGMTQSARAYVTDDPNTISNIQVAEGKELTVTWSHSASTPEGGWLLLYSVDGGKTSKVVKCDTASAVIDDLIPGAWYQLTIQAADGSTVFGGEHTHTCTKAKDFNMHSLSNEDLMVSLCHTPAADKWTYKDVDSYTSTYAPNARVSMVLYSTSNFKTPSEDMEITYVIRDAEGNIIIDLLRTETRNWKDMWTDRYAYLNVPALPTEAGSYQIDLYFAGSYVLTKKVNIT